MAAASEGEDSGLRDSPLGPDPAGETSLDLEILGGSPESAVTQLLPMVQRESSVEGVSVRAVARRQAAALPALGRDGPTEASHSARVTADRRRQAAKAATVDGPDSDGPDSDTPDSDGPALDLPVAVAAVRSPSPQAALRPEPARVATPPLMGQPPAGPAVVADPPVEIEPVETRVEPKPIVEAEIIEGDAARDQATRQPAGTGPVSRTAAVASIGAATAEMLSALTEVAFREARTDEWIVEPAMLEPAMFEPAGRESGWFNPPGGREPSSELARADPRPGFAVSGRPLSSTALLEPVRTGPRMLDADSWDVTPQPAIEPDYQGRRRAGVTSARLWLVIGLVVAALSAAIAVPFLLTSGASSPSTSRSPGGAVLPDGGASSDISGMSSPGSSVTGGSTGLPAVGASPPVSTAAASDPPAAGSGTSAAIEPGGFAPLSVEAEVGGSATAWGGTATRTTFAGASGGSIIDGVGEWPGSDGWLEFRSVNVPSAGTYVLQFSYVYKTFGWDNPRRLRIIVNGTALSGGEQTFTSVSSIQTRTVNVTLRAGSDNTIRLTNSSSQSPAIDKIVISKP